MTFTVLITGVGGLLGSRLADWIINNKPQYKVIGIDNLSGGFQENINSKVDFYNCDLVDDNINEIFKRNKIDYVYHFAAYAAEGLSPFIRSFNYDNNLKATSRVVNECIRYNIKRIVFTSSLAVYGHGNGNVFDEKQQQAPIDPYGVAKYACEMDIQIAGQQHDLDWCIIRPHNVYGKNQNIWDKYRNVLGIWMYQMINEMDVTIYGDGKQTRAFSYIDDILEPLWNAAVKEEASKQIINLGGIEKISINEASLILKEITGKGKIVYLENRHEVMHSIPTYQKSIDILNFKHKTSLKEGLRDMRELAITQPNRDRYVWENYELDAKMYSYWKV